MMTSEPNSAGCAFKEMVRSYAPKLAIFDADDYRSLNPDLRDVEPFQHFAEYGIWERRLTISAERRTANLARAISQIVVEHQGPCEIERAYRGVRLLSPSIHLASSASDDEYLLCDRLVSALDAVGLSCSIREGPPNRKDEAALVISPAKVFESDIRQATILRLKQCLSVVLSSPSTTSFMEELPFLLASGGVVAVEAEAYALIRTLGINAVWSGFPPLEVDASTAPAYPLSDGLSPVMRNAPQHLPWRDRPIDVVTLEAASVARSLAWTRMSGGLASFITVMQTSPPGFPIPQAMRSFLYARSKVVLHLHEDSPASIPSVLAAEVAGSGAVLVSEPSPSNLLLSSGMHFFDASARRIPTLLHSLFKTDEGASAAQKSTVALHNTLSSAFDPVAVGLAITSVLLDLQGEPQ